MSASVPRRISSSSRLAIATTATGQSGAVVRQQLGHDRVDALHGQVQHERARLRPSVARSSPGGIGVARAAMRVRITVWPTPGTVSSRRSAAAAAANAGTPGTISYGTPSASSRRICSATR